ASVRTAFLQSVVPIDVAIPGPFPSTSQAALEQMLQACMADTSCRTAFPNLRAELTEVIARLDSGKARVSIRESGGTAARGDAGAPARTDAGAPASADAGAAVLDRGRVAEWFRSKLYRPQSAAPLPWLIHQAYMGHWQPIADGILAGAQRTDSEL